MSAEEDAFQACRDEIARVKAAGGTELFFDREEFRELTRVPEEISEHESLVSVDLDNTQVNDFTPLYR